MKTLMSITLLWFAPVVSLAAETLPDTAPPDSEAPQTSERLQAEPLEGDELEALYLASPLELEVAEERQGMGAVTEETRYLQERERELQQRQAETVRPPKLIEEGAPPPPPPTTRPMVGL